MPGPAETDPPPHVAFVDGLPVRLSGPYDLSFLGRWGRVFRVFDDQDSGNLCAGLERGADRVYVKFAGAPTVRSAVDPEHAVTALRSAQQVYEELRGPNVIVLREAVECGGGFALVFDWVDADPLGRQYGEATRVRALPVAVRSAAVQSILDVHVRAAARGWVAVDLYDGSVLVDPSTGAATLCDLDFYRRGPSVNDRGRMWGSARFMSPEEYERGARIDEVTTVFALGALTHSFLGDDAEKDRGSWAGTPAQFAVAARALEPDRSRRWPSVAALADGWREASARV